MEFSIRTAWDTSESALTAAIRQRRAAGERVYDLTVSNPTVCGFSYDAAALLRGLANPAALVYDPDPRGILSARQAVAGYYAEHRAEVRPEQLVLTTSTSEAYSYLFRLLANPGDEVLVPQPSYPLFDFLAALDDVQLKAYPLFHDFGWWIDFAELERAIGPRTRAILVVHPNNPTGHLTERAERQRLEQLCVRHGLALIVDEVFLDYPVAAPAIESFACGPHPALTFVLSGLSKIAALPQMKVGWLACRGPATLEAKALVRLEIIADTFLSMNAPAQHALPGWLATRVGIAGQIRARVLENLRAVPLELSPLMPEAGWSAILRLPVPAEDRLEELVRTAGVIVHPGSFYGVAGRNRVVVSLLGRPAEFAEGVAKLKLWCESS